MAVGRILIVLVTLLSSLGVQGYFDCIRPGQDCANSKTCSDNGTCDCGSSYTGYNCGLSTSEKGQTPCTSETDSCGSDGGLCYKNETAKACYCPANLYGDHCENKRYTVECMQSSMKITLTPAGTFNGVIYVHGKKETDGCTFTDTSGTLELDLQDSSDCGEVTSNTESGDRSRVIMMQYSSKYITDRDTKLTVTCSGGAGTVDVTAAFISQDGNNKEQAISGTNPIDIASDAVDFVIKLKDDSVVNNATVVSLNDQLTFQFDVNGEKAPGGQSCEYSVINDTTMTVEPDVTLSETSVEDCKKACNANPQCKFFTHLRDSCMIRYVSSETDYNPDEQFYEKHCASTATLTVMQCEASNGQSGDNKETMKLIENICPSEEVGKLMEQDPSRDTNNQVVFKMRPFKFNHNNAISIDCTVKVCTGNNSAECPAPDCSGSNRRKRRSAELSDERVRRTIYILDPELESTRTSDTSKNKSVSVNDVTTPIVAGVAIVIILLLVVCIVVLLVVKKRRSKQKSQDEGVNNHTI